MGDLATHAVSGLCVDDAIVLSLWRYNHFYKISSKHVFKGGVESLQFYLIVQECINSSLSKYVVSYKNCQVL